jgi:DMSO reductase anchor subunit
MPGTGALGGATGLLGIAGVTASAFIYLVPARPAWNSKHTLAEFWLTGALLGPLFVAAVSGSTPQLQMAVLIAAGLQLLNQGLKFLWLARSEDFELKASARLLSNDLDRLLVLRFALLVAAMLLKWPVAALSAALVGELLGRYLFFVSVVPKNMAASFFSKEAA